MKNVQDQPSLGSTHAGHNLPRRIGKLLLIILGVLVSLIIALPIFLLFVATSVSWVISSALVLLYCAVVFALFRFAHTLPMILVALVGMISLSALAVVASQLLASTPSIRNVQGNVIPGSIATLESIELNGSNQWMTIRGQSEDLPGLLFLAGGPGGSELVMTRRYLAELEEHFIVVNWDQPGTGKSYNAVAFDELTPERYVDDAYALTLYLRERFGEDKTYVFGESWGCMV